MSKSRDAFRTISEVSDVLDTPAHVLRFWESKFTQVKPVKRAGGRRYYRPNDVDLLAGIKQLLHDDGMTIKGAQKLLREQGVKHVSALGSAALEDLVPAAPADIEIKSNVPETMAEPAPITKVEAPEPGITLDITNVVPLPATPAPGPMLSLNLAPKAEQQDETPPAPTPEPARTFPSDPSDADSKAPARFFNHLHKASHDKLVAQTATIAPLLDRMQDLRARIATR